MDFNSPEKIVGLALNVHRGSGPGMLEHYYEQCFAGELTEDNMSHQVGATMPRSPRSRMVQPRYRVDLLINGRVIVELKGDGIADPGRR
jgi:GxxExxY protein